jgi:hypothetical protein
LRSAHELVLTGKIADDHATLGIRIVDESSSKIELSVSESGQQRAGGQAQLGAE